MTKVCSKCHVEKSIEEFAKHPTGAGGRRATCRTCNTLAHKAWRAKNPEKDRAIARRYNAKHAPQMRNYCRKYRAVKADAIRDNELFRKYGITLEQYDAMFEIQGGVCAICGKPETAELNGVPKRLAVDHDHTTGLARGLLCGHCNVGLGALGDDPCVLVAATNYLLRHKQ